MIEKGKVRPPDSHEVGWIKHHRKRTEHHSPDSTECPGDVFHDKDTILQIRLCMQCGQDIKNLWGKS